MKVYLAGKIAKNDWRHAIFKGLRDHEPSRDNALTEKHFEYAGPYFIADDHGTCHGRNTHGRGAGKPLNQLYGEQSSTPQQVVDSCLEQIKNADALFVWLDKSDAYGTIVEIGYAKALSIPVFIALDSSFKGNEFSKDVWFALKCADSWTHKKNADMAWKWFTKVSKTDKSELAKSNREEQRLANPASPKQQSYVLSLIAQNAVELTKPIEEVTGGEAGALISYFTKGKGRPSVKALIVKKEIYPTECIYSPTEVVHILKEYYNIRITLSQHSVIVRKEKPLFEDSPYCEEFHTFGARRLYSQEWIDRVIEILEEEAV